MSTQTRLDVLAEFIEVPKHFFSDTSFSGSDENYHQFHSPKLGYKYHAIFANDEERTLDLECHLDEMNEFELQEEFGTTDIDLIKTDLNHIKSYRFFLGEYKGYSIYANL